MGNEARKCELILQNSIIDQLFDLSESWFSNLYDFRIGTRCSLRLLSALNAAIVIWLPLACLVKMIVLSSDMFIVMFWYFNLAEEKDYGEWISSIHSLKMWPWNGYRVNIFGENLLPLMVLFKTISKKEHYILYGSEDKRKRGLLNCSSIEKPH